MFNQILFKFYLINDFNHYLKAYFMIYMIYLQKFRNIFIIYIKINLILILKIEQEAFDTLTL